MRKRSDRDKFTEVYTEFYHTVYNTIYSKVGSMEDSEDLCQEVFIILYKKLNEIDNIRKWLFGTLKNIVLKFYRDKKPNSQDIDTIFDDINLTFLNGFRDTRMLLESVIEEVITNEEERNLIELISYYNYSYKAVASLMGMTKRQVDYKYTQLATRILYKLKQKGIKNIEELL